MSFGLDIMQISTPTLETVSIGDKSNQEKAPSIENDQSPAPGMSLPNHLLVLLFFLPKQLFLIHFILLLQSICQLMPD